MGLFSLLSLLYVGIRLVMLYLGSRIGSRYRGGNGVHEGKEHFRLFSGLNRV